MKKIRILFCFALCVFLCACDSGTVQGHSSTAEEKLTKTDYTNYAVYELDDPNSEFNKLIESNGLDQQYRQDLDEAGTVLQMIQVELKYQSLWQEELRNAVEKCNRYLTNEDKQALAQTETAFALYQEKAFAFDSDLLLKNEYDIHLGETAKWLLHCEKKEAIRERAIHVKYLLYILERANNTGAAQTSTYEIKTEQDTASYEGSKIAYPFLISNSVNVDKVNELIRQELDSYITALIADCLDGTTFELDYSITFESNEMICIFFEGMRLNKQAAHPTNIAFSVIVSLQEQQIIAHDTLITVDGTFVQALRHTLASGDTSGMFADEHWPAVAEYINGYTDNEIAEKIRTDLRSTTALTENGVLVLFPVPHAIGDYVKITVTK